MHGRTNTQRATIAERGKDKEPDEIGKIVAQIVRADPPRCGEGKCERNTRPKQRTDSHPCAREERPPYEQLRKGHRDADRNGLRERHGFNKRRERPPCGDKKAQRVTNRTDAIGLQKTWVEDELVQTGVEQCATKEGAQDHRCHTHAR